MMCGETRVGATGIVWRCVREDHTEPEEMDARTPRWGDLPLPPPQDRHHFVAVR